MSSPTKLRHLKRFVLVSKRNSRQVQKGAPRDGQPPERGIIYMNVKTPPQAARVWLQQRHSTPWPCR